MCPTTRFPTLRTAPPPIVLSILAPTIILLLSLRQPFAILRPSLCLPTLLTPHRLHLFPNANRPISTHSLYLSSLSPSNSQGSTLREHWTHVALFVKPPVNLIHSKRTPDSSDPIFSKHLHRPTPFKTQRSAPLDPQTNVLAPLENCFARPPRSHISSTPWSHLRDSTSQSLSLSFWI